MKTDLGGDDSFPKTMHPLEPKRQSYPPGLPIEVHGWIAPYGSCSCNFRDDPHMRWCQLLHSVAQVKGWTAGLKTLSLAFTLLFTVIYASWQEEIAEMKYRYTAVIFCWCFWVTSQLQLSNLVASGDIWFRYHDHWKQHTDSWPWWLVRNVGAFLSFLNRFRLIVTFWDPLH